MCLLLYLSGCVCVCVCIDLGSKFRLGSVWTHTAEIHTTTLALPPLCLHRGAHSSCDSVYSSVKWVHQSPCLMGLLQGLTRGHVVLPGAQQAPTRVHVRMSGISTCPQSAPLRHRWGSSPAPSPFRDPLFWELRGFLGPNVV